VSGGRILNGYQDDVVESPPAELALAPGVEDLLSNWWAALIVC